MALRLNLYHEIEREKRAKSRDPLKLGILAVLCVATGMVAYYFWQLSVLNGIEQNYRTTRAQFEDLVPKAEAAKKREQEWADIVKAKERLVERMEERFHWAPFLAQLSNAVEGDVQITKLSGEVQGSKVRRCNLSLEGVAAGPDPRKTAEQVRVAIRNELQTRFKVVNATFRTLEESPTPVSIQGKPHGTALFQIQVQVATGEETPPKPPTRKKK
jgi:Tfp pilus assembly protein PilN